MMTPRDAVILLAGFAAGTGLGAGFFGGLWWTVNRLLLGGLSTSWLVGSAVARFSLVLVGFPLVAGNHWQRWLAVLAGFIAVRIAMSRLLPSLTAGSAGAFSRGSSRRAT
jgi:F1F0 ATPase subunit 2